MILGIDTGGTFTDAVSIDPTGALIVRKTPSTPGDPSEAILRAVEFVGASPGYQLVHGTTVATNALLERRGARTALLTTQGCRDVLEIARQTRSELYSLSPSPRDPLIPRDLRFEVPERLDFQGNVITSLDPQAVGRVLDKIKECGAESVAVCFLFSFLRPEHEQIVGALARKRNLFVSLSSDIAPELREYERTATVCANAYVGPVMSRYIGNLRNRLQTAGAQRTAIMQSNGGWLRAEEASEVAVKTVLSGPAGGLIAAVKTAQSAGFSRIITFDMGGTSTDVALVDGETRTIRTGEVAGIPLLTPMLDIHTVGAGGGSIARIDRGGALKVGPESAGANPGPVAYGRGDDLTVTDANVLLGRLPSDVRLAGSVALDAGRVAEKFEELAARMGVSPKAAAEGVLAVVNANMARAIRHISTERGHDPAEYTMVAFGGAGGLHACDLADTLRIPRVLIPRFPGAFSAMGLALSDAKRERVRSLFARVDEAGEARVCDAIAELNRMILGELAEEGFRKGEICLGPFVEMQYVGQSYALRVDFRRSLAQCAPAFHRAHKLRYGYADRSAPVEVVAAGSMGSGRSSVTAVHLPDNGMRMPPSSPTEAPVRYHGSDVMARLEHRNGLAKDKALAGPAIVLQDDATTFVPPGWTANLDRLENLLLHRN